MNQQMADHIDQLDLALDQLALRDRNFDRFALLLIDNVVELVLHQHAKDQSIVNESRRRPQNESSDIQALTAALGQRFDAKVAFACKTDLLPHEFAQSIRHLHAFRNTAYHRGLRHEGILHSLALFYFRSACELLRRYSPLWWSWSSNDSLSHRARKYLGTATGDPRKNFEAAWSRLDEVAAGMKGNLISDLHADMEKTIDRVNGHIDFVLDGMPKASGRDDVIVSSQLWPIAFTEEAKAWARDNGSPGDLSVNDYVNWLAKHYPLVQKVDPIPSWRQRLESLANESDEHKALNKYADFMRQTEKFRECLDEVAAQYDMHIQNQIDLARGK